MQNNNCKAPVIKITLITITTVIIAACSSYKKTSASTASSVPVSTTTVSSAPASTTTVTNDLLPAKPADGIYAPGNEELMAIQAQYKDVTLNKLKEGYALYAQSACVSCHSPLNIYTIPDAKCKGIIGDMAQRARISDEQRDAVYKYVLAIKAAQPKQVK